MSLSHVFWGVHFGFYCLTADFSGSEGLVLSMSLASSLFFSMFVVFWCSVTGLVVSESYKVLMLSQTSLLSWVNRYLYCSIYAVVFCGCFFPDIV